ncbi:hypothetical protein WMY93_004968 [Mugilogobius chulae]|uniref:Uncharacterized protein n=1 Tax=Mugilogobius chulae TaxID=88201 RepID=A0AAW0PQ73_9GOBI
MFAGTETRLEDVSCTSWSYNGPVATAMSNIDPYSFAPHPPYISSPPGPRLSAVAHQSSPHMGEHMVNEAYSNQNGPTQSSQNIHSRQTSPPLREYRYTPNASPPLYHTLESHTHMRCGLSEWSAAS